MAVAATTGKALEALGYADYSDDYVVALIVGRAVKRRIYGDERGDATKLRKLVADTYPPRGKKGARLKAVEQRLSEIRELRAERAKAREGLDEIHRTEAYYREWGDYYLAPHKKEQRQSAFIRRTFERLLYQCWVGNVTTLWRNQANELCVVERRGHLRHSFYRRANDGNVYRTDFHGTMVHDPWEFRVRGGYSRTNFERMGLEIYHPDGRVEFNAWDTDTPVVKPRTTQLRRFP
jgi:hypothetical protein